MYLINKTEHEKLIDLLSVGDAAGAQALLQERATEQNRLREAYEGSIACANSNFGDDDCRIDDMPVISEADNGVWVGGWLWVANGYEEDEDSDPPDDAGY